MAFVIEDCARSAVARRRADHKPAVIDVHVSPVLHGGATVAVNWESRCEKDGRASIEQDGVTLCVDRRIAHYARWQDVVISAQQLGPFEWLTVQDPLILTRLGEWQRAHPALAS